MVSWNGIEPRVNGGDPFGDLPLGEGFMFYQLVGEVTAHQGYDG